MAKIFFVFLVIVSVFLPSHVFADTTAALLVTPVIMRLDLRTDSPDSVITYKNTSRTPVDITLSAKDFNGLDEFGKVNILDEKDAANYQYSLSSWIHFQTTTISLNPDEVKQIPFHIDKEKLPLGGHYATILASFSERDTNGMIPLHGILSTLVFVRAGKGYEREEARIVSSGIENTFLSFPKSVFFRLQNTGNVDITPYGLITLTDMFGRSVAKGIINEGSLVTLPESIRRYPVLITKTSPFLFPSLYHIQIALHYGSTNKKITTELTFFSQGTINFVRIFEVIAIFLIAIWLFRLWKRPFRD